MQDNLHSRQQDADTKSYVSDCWYPTIYFYDLTLNKVVWEIFGAEVFIDIEK